MDEAILRVHFPEGSLPTRGYRCPICFEESVLFKDAEAVQALARRLGLFGVEHPTTRKVLRTGGSLAVTLDPALVEAAAPGLKAGDTVRVGLQGRRIVIEPVKD